MERLIISFTTLEARRFAVGSIPNARPARDAPLLRLAVDLQQYALPKRCQWLSSFDGQQ